MSALWSARVEERLADGVVLALRAVHPDAGELTGSPVFAFRVLVDAPRDPAVPRPPVEEEAALASAVVRSVEVGGVRNSPFDEEAARAGVERALRERGLAPQDGEAWAEAFGERWRELWADPDRAPSGRLTVLVGDPAWVAGLGPGAEWETSAW
ncbi:MULTISPECIES: hypothetical protein [Actinosynnema]|uniref:hypothetical protein n=1 Tax=Actinosynnema TaxID=40566 RepID=UPI0020A28B53|nr:hypothetical protein [Actinosynnema pretiosum]MCP2098747.1 hypothetical protein [Actinosynnema pretiosum]